MTLYDEQIIKDIVKENSKWLDDPYKRKYRRYYDEQDVQHDLIPDSHKNDEYLKLKTKNETTNTKNQLHYY